MKTIFDELNFEMAVNFLDHIQTKSYLLVGFGMGTLWDILKNNSDDILITLILGFTGAIGAGIAKILINTVDRKMKKKDKEKEDE